MIEAFDPRLPMILSPYSGTLLHEAVGHALEADYLADSPLRFHGGERISHEELTVEDRPDVAGFAGSMSRDDSGTPTSATTLLHRGVLVGDLSFGHGAWRRGNYRELPQIRATNFLIKSGSDDPGQWLHSLPECYYVAWIQSGNWLPGSARFKAMTGHVLHYRAGRAIARADWLPLTLPTLDLLARIIAAGNDFTMDPVVHWCVKKNQAVPMGMGGPSLLLRGEAS